MPVLLNEYKKIQFLVDSLVLPFIKNQHPKWRELILTYLEFLDENALNKSMNITDNVDANAMYSELLDEFLDLYFKDVVDLNKFGLNDDNKRLFISLSKLIGNLKATKTSFGFFFNSFSDFSIPSDTGDISITDMAIELREMPNWWLENNDPTRPFTYIFKIDTPELSNLKELIKQVHPAGWLQLFLFEISFDDESGQGEYMNGYDCFELDITHGVYYTGKFNYDGTMLIEGVSYPMYYDGGYTFSDDLNCAPTPRYFTSGPAISFDLTSDIDAPVMPRHFSSSPSIVHDLTSDIELPAAPEEHILMVYAETGDGTIIGDDADWATARGTATEAYQQSNNETGMGVNNFGGPYYIVGRSFFEFDLSFFDGVDRTITGIDLDLVAFSRVESSFQCYSTTFTGVTALGDYNDFGSTIFFDTAQTMVLWDGGNYARNPLPLNAAGLAYVATKYSDKAAFCLREYPHDVLDSAPDANPYRNGVYHMEIGWSEYQRQPRLTLTYNKMPNWVQHFGPTDFTITNSATWDGVKYIAGGGSVDLTPVGTWFDDNRPIKVRVTFEGDGDNLAWIEMRNTEGSGELLAGRNQVNSGDEVYINNYGNYDLDDFYIFIDTGAFVTNIEFLYP